VCESSNAADRGPQASLPTVCTPPLDERRLPVCPRDRCARATARQSAVSVFVGRVAHVHPLTQQVLVNVRDVPMRGNCCRSEYGNVGMPRYFAKRETGNCFQNCKKDRIPTNQLEVYRILQKIAPNGILTITICHTIQIYAGS